MASIGLIQRPKKLKWATHASLIFSGLMVIFLALISWLAAMPVAELFGWLQRMFSLSFMVVYSLLIALGIYSIVRIRQGKHRFYWHEMGLQAASGIATLALTFTLLGISLGIGSLSESNLTPETVNTVISKLTQHFATAFMTTVVGLPTAALLRAWVSLCFINVKSEVTP